MISIIVPVYNVEKYLPQCLDSLVNQTYRDIEIICVNDGSTDNSQEILEKYAATDERVVIVCQENQGLSGARNTGIDAARGEWIMFVDSDDWIEHGTCRLALEAATGNQADSVLWAYSREYAGCSLPKYYIAEQKTWEGEEVRLLHRRMVGPTDAELAAPDTMDAYGTIWGKLYKTSLINNPNHIRFIDTKRIGSAEDVLFNIEYMGRIDKAVYIPAALYHYRKDNVSFTSQHKPDLPAKWDRQYAEIEKVLRRQCCGDDFFTAYQNRISLGIIGLGLNEIFSGRSFMEKNKEVARLLNRPIYREAIQKLVLKYFPIHWKIFFWCAMHNISIGITILLSVINRIIHR